MNNGVRVSSSPDLLPMSTTNNNLEDLSLEGISTNVKLLLKLIQDHQEASHKGNIDERKEQRFAGIMSILEDVKTRLQKSQATTKKSKAELRRCNTDLRINDPPKDDEKKDETTLDLDDKDRLRNDLNMSLAAQKRLGVMCASLGREKDIITRELTRKVQEVKEMEQHVKDLRAQNEKLSAKVQACVAEHKEVKQKEGSENHINYAVSQQRNKELSEQLLKSLEGYKSIKKKLKEVQEERDRMKAAMEEVGDEVKHSFHLLNNLKKCAGNNLGEQPREIEEKITSLEQVFETLEVKTELRPRREGKQRV